MADEQDNSKDLDPHGLFALTALDSVMRGRDEEIPEIALVRLVNKFHELKQSIDDDEIPWTEVLGEVPGLLQDVRKAAPLFAPIGEEALNTLAAGIAWLAKQAIRLQQEYDGTLNALALAKAQAMRRTYTALQQVEFTPQQAMQILLVEIGKDSAHINNVLKSVGNSIKPRLER